MIRQFVKGRVDDPVCCARSASDKTVVVSAYIANYQCSAARRSTPARLDWCDLQLVDCWHSQTWYGGVLFVRYTFKLRQFIAITGMLAYCVVDLSRTVLGIRRWLHLEPWKIFWAWLSVIISYRGEFWGKA